MRMRRRLGEAASRSFRMINMQQFERFYMLLPDEWLKPGPESRLDCLIGAEFAGYRGVTLRVADMRMRRRLGEAASRSFRMISKKSCAHTHTHTLTLTITLTHFHSHTYTLTH